jgi:acetyltransferase-like isoleucine patch superfamily enzyme
MDTSRRSEKHPGVEFVELAGPVAVFPNVTIGEGSVIHGPCILGHPPKGKEPGELPVLIGANAMIRAFGVIYAGTTIGDGFQTGHHFLIREDNVLGDDCVVGSQTVVGNRSRIGNRVQMHSKVGMAGVTIEDDVYLAPGCRFADDPHMPCPRSSECIGGPRIKRGAVIGAGAVVMPGVTVGRRAVVGALALVTQDVPDEMVVVGNPARVLKRVDELECWPGLYERPYIWSEYIMSEPDLEQGID